MAQTAKAQATADRISEAAGQLFAQNGYQKTSVAQVAARAEVAVGTVLLHYGSKSELATATFAHQVASAVKVALRKRPPQETPVAELAAIAGSMYRWYAKQGPVASDLLQQALFSTGPWGEQYDATVRQTVAAFSEIISRYQQVGKVASQLDVALTAQSILAAYLLVLLQGLRGMHSSPRKQLTHFVAMITPLLAS